MHLTLRQLQCFSAVAKNLSYTRAAEELHLTQPAVSMQIRQLEQQAGLALTEQLGKQVYLTEAGEEVHRYARSILQQVDEMDVGCTLPLFHLQITLPPGYSVRFTSVIPTSASAWM
jgi:DNA-binding transcriptional LysR family regulator